MNRKCPNCDNANIKEIKTKEKHTYKDMDFIVDVEYYVCLECFIEFETFDQPDYLEKIYEEYDKIKKENK